MKNRKTSIIWTTPKEELQKLLNESNSFVEVFKKLNLNPYTGNHRTLNQRIKKENLCLNKLKENRIKSSRENLKKMNSCKTLNNNIFCENSTYASRQNIKKKLIKFHNVKYECSICLNKGEHFGKQLKLQLDHINGINNDNRVENLRLLCPNCHSQTDNFSGKSLKKKKLKKRNEAKILYQKELKEKIENLIWIKPLNQISKDLNLSDVSISKWCKKLNIKKPPRCYWNNILSGKNHEESLIPKIKKEPNFTLCNKEELEKIFLLQKEGKSLRSIGKLLNRHHTTISRAIKNGVS
jgi:5-methylcytosine-specific restriction endonuclease McrA